MGGDPGHLLDVLGITPHSSRGWLDSVSVGVGDTPADARILVGSLGSSSSVCLKDKFFAAVKFEAFHVERQRDAAPKGVLLRRQKA